MWRRIRAPQGRYGEFQRGSSYQLVAGRLFAAPEAERSYFRNADLGFFLNIQYCRT